MPHRPLDLLAVIPLSAIHPLAASQRMSCLHGNRPLIRLSAIYLLRGYPLRAYESFGFHK